MTAETSVFDVDAINGLIHAGVHGTFLRLPHIPANKSALAAAGATVAFLGFPWDAMCISRTGTNYGPRALRDASDQFSLYNGSTEIDLNEHYTLVDCGDVAVVPGGAKITIDRAEAMVAEILNAGAMPITMGGDHSISIACVRAFRRKYDNPGLVLVDTHYDTALEVGGEELSHCCPITRAVDCGFDPAKIVIVGPGGWMNPKNELAYCREKGITIFTIEDVWEQGAKAIARKAAAIAGAGTDTIYFTYDIDSIDAAYAPGTGVPTPGGLTSREAITIVQEISKAGIGGMDIVEISPSWDHDGITSRLGCRLILEALQGNAMAAS